MNFEDVKSTLGTVAGYDVDSGPRGEKARKAIAIAIKTIEFCERLFDMMMEVRDEDGEHHEDFYALIIKAVDEDMDQYFDDIDLGDFVTLYRATDFLREKA